MSDNWIIDDISGFKIKASEAKKLSGEQKGLLTHESQWNPAHPQLRIKGKSDKQNVAKVRLRPPDTFPAPITQDDL